MSTRTPSLASLLNTFKAQAFADLRVCLPARVESYDSSKQTVDVQPLVKDTFKEADGSRSVSSLPVINAVPVVFPGGGGHRIIFPLQKGDTVLLVFADRSIDGWQDQGIESTPPDDRRHHLSDAIAIPGLHASNAPWSDAGDPAITLGSDSGTLDNVALASLVKAEIQALRNTVNALVTTFNTHTHVESGGTTAPPATPGVGPAAVGDVKSNTVKIKG